MNPTRLYLAASTTVYLAAVVLANVLTDHYGLVHVWWGLLVTAGTYAAGFALLARDFVQRHARPDFGPRGVYAYLVAVILTAGALSWWLASPGLAKASVIAFLSAEAVDLLVFTPLSTRRGFIPAALVSNIVSAPVDTLMFLWVAGFPITAQAVTGQFIGKVLWATLIPLTAYALLRSRRTP